MLAWEPARWLIGTWYAPGYDGLGITACAVTAGLFAWSLNSPLIAADRAGSRGHAMVFGLLLLTATLRLLAQLLDINLLGALLLSVDVYALACLFRLDRRVRPLSPFWLAAAFCFCLPVEPVMQRMLGYGLQQLSAGLACATLAPFYDPLSCPGVRLVIDEIDVLVDLPCSGTQLLSISGFAIALLHAFFRPGVLWSGLGVVGAALCALLLNSLRISTLAVGIRHAEELPFEVMAPIPHTVIGLAFTVLASLLLFVMVRSYPARRGVGADVVANPADNDRLKVWRWRVPRCSRGPSLPFACLFLVFALAVGGIQPRPVDASPAVLPPRAPLVAADFLAQPEPLSHRERRYFSSYGGAATRASYGPYGLMLVRSNSPLRHMHDPVVCLRGQGFDVELLGTDHATATTVYRAQAPGANAYNYDIYVSFVSDSGQLASSISEVVWHWLFDDRRAWTMVQRIVPVSAGGAHRAAADWHQAIRRAFNLRNLRI